ncbi:hypothetical protein [Paenibacillus harenae]|uniref:hypothetical protein n=1 Tax=Paenibacillus harenae TaxID=306543 RepID=UPI0003FFC039|nr:hypothetical protein [Paenibacillus harenae]
MESIRILGFWSIEYVLFIDRVASWFAISGVLITAVGAGTYLMPSVNALGKEPQAKSE